MSFIAFIFSFFVGDASINGYPIGLPLFFFAVLIITSIKIEKKDLLNTLILTTFFLLNLYKGYEINYIFWPLNAIFLSLILRSIDIRAFSKSFMTIFIIIWFVINMIYTNFGTSRFDFIFGPNVQYRIFMVFFILFMINYNQVFNLKTKLSIFLSTLGGILTGSRGFLPLFAISNIFFAIERNFYGRRGFFLIFISLIIGISFYDLIYSQISNSRLFFFNVENTSLSSRLSLVNQFFSDPASLISLLGINETERLNIFYFGFPYPHNFILEIFIYYGFFGFLLTLLFIINNLPKSDSPYIPILIAACVWSLFSGDFGDNYVIFSILVAASAYKKEIKWN